MTKPKAFSFHRYDRPLVEWERAHQEFLRKFGKTLYRHSKRQAKFQLNQESVTIQDLEAESSAFFLVPLSRLNFEFVVLHLPHNFWDMLVNLLNGGKLKFPQNKREMTALDESTLGPLITDLFKDLEESFKKRLGLCPEKRVRESSVPELSLRIGEQKIKKFEVKLELESEVILTFSLLYPYSTLSGLRV